MIILSKEQVLQLHIDLIKAKRYYSCIGIWRNWRRENIAMDY